MADQNAYVAYLCQWCGLNFHDTTDGEHAMPPVMPIGVYNDDDQYRQYCSRYCVQHGYEYYK